MSAAGKTIYQVAVANTPGFYETCIRSVGDYARRIGANHIVQTEPILRIRPKNSARSENALRHGYLPIYEKENAFDHLKFGAVLILDADVYVRPTAPDIFQLANCDFAGVVEREMPLTPNYFDKIRKYSKGQYEFLDDVDWKWNSDGAEFFNMGVMLLNPSIQNYIEGTPREFIERPEFERFVNGEGHWRWSTDQTLLNYWVKKSGMTTRHLDWRWNALYGAVKNIETADFVHFFLSAKLPQGGKEIPGIIRGL